MSTATFPSFCEGIALMMKSAITLSLVEEARGGPFVFWGDAKHAISQAQQMGFDAIEIFPPDADTLRAQQVGTPF